MPQLRQALLAAALALAAGAGASFCAPPAAPERVVSMNLCTDQLAMMLAAPGQLLSVSYISHDPRASSMVEEAAAYPANRGLAEEIFLLAPDLVIAGAFTTRATVEMLRRLGIPVVTMQPAYRLGDVPARLREMGAHLGRENAAEALVQDFEAGLAAFPPPGARPRAATYGARGYSAGPDSLSGGIIAAAGLENVAAELGLGLGARLALEELVLAAPDLLILPQPYPGASHAEELLAHPALAALRRDSGVAPLSDRDWICGTPHVLAAVADLARARETWIEARP